MTIATAGSTNRASKFRGTDDHYPTPEGATWALANLNILPHRVWEPACGDGAMARVLASAGYDVAATTLVDRGYGETGADFLQETALRAPAIVTNPPFGIADDFVAHALDLQPDMACFLLNLKWLSSRRRFERIYRRGALAEVHVFIERLVFFAGDLSRDKQSGYNTEIYAWFVFRAGHTGPWTGGWVSRDSAPPTAPSASFFDIDDAPAAAAPVLELFT